MVRNKKKIYWNEILIFFPLILVVIFVFLSDMKKEKVKIEKIQNEGFIIFCHKRMYVKILKGGWKKWGGGNDSSRI